MSDNNTTESENNQPDDSELTSDELASLDALLSEPHLWDELDPEIEDFLVHTIAAEMAAELAPVTELAPARELSLRKTAGRPGGPTMSSGEDRVATDRLTHDGIHAEEASNVVSIFSRSRARLASSVLPFAAGIAAALLLFVGIGTFTDSSEGDQGIELALAGTDLAPTASANALIDQGPLGVRIRLDVSGLPPSPEGTYYEAWVRKSPEVGVSAGTFHLRGGDGEIELWAGVSTDDYPLITVTLQQEGDGPASSGKVVLKGRLVSEENGD